MSIGRKRRGRPAPQEEPARPPVPGEEIPEETAPEPETPDEGEERSAPGETEREALDRERAELEAEKKEFARRQMEAAVAEALSKRGLPAAFAPWLAGETPEESAQRLDTFELLFREAVAAAVTERMRGDGPPREPAKPRGYSREELRALSRREINAHWEEVQRSLRHN